MIGLLATSNVLDELKLAAREFLSAMRDHAFEHVWEQMILPESALFISAAIWPIYAYNAGKVDALLQLDQQQDISLFEGLALAFQTDAESMRSGFLSGIAHGLEPTGWYEFSDTDCLAFVDGDSAVFTAGTLKRPLILVFVRDRGGPYKIDLSALAIFSMEIRASTLYYVANRAQELGNTKEAVAYYELTANLAATFARLRRLVWDHVVLNQSITPRRKEELEAEAKYVLLARDQVLRSFSYEESAMPNINIGQFLHSNFKGYSSIVSVNVNQEELNQLYSLNDDALRHKVASLLIGVDPVYAEREANKPHSGIEIADIELPISIGKDTHYLCMPFKSGLEIKSDKVPVDVAYQIIRPFMYMPKCIVVFVTAKPCSQYLHNYIKQAIATQGWAIGVIEFEALAKLLKLNNLLFS